MWHLKMLRYLIILLTENLILYCFDTWDLKSKVLNLRPSKMLFANCRLSTSLFFKNKSFEFIDDITLTAWFWQNHGQVEVETRSFDYSNFQFKLNPIESKTFEKYLLLWINRNLLFRKIIIHILLRNSRKIDYVQILLIPMPYSR